MWGGLTGFGLLTWVISRGSGYGLDKKGMDWTGVVGPQVDLGF